MISLTPRAICELKRLLPTNSFVRVGVKGGGCSGFSYTMGFDDVKSDVDQSFEIDGVAVVCDPKSFLYLNGIQIDYQDGLINCGFKFDNPNADKSCGCGESFSV